MELRLVTAKLVTEFEFRFADGSSDSEVLNVKDSFSAIPGPLQLVFSARA